MNTIQKQTRNNSHVPSTSLSNSAFPSKPNIPEGPDNQFLTILKINIIKSLSEENHNFSLQIDGFQATLNRFGANLEAAKKIISRLVSQQIHKGHYSYNELSDEIHQQHHKDLYQCVNVYQKLRQTKDW